jgi:hypothetical protein
MILFLLLPPLLFFAFALIWAFQRLRRIERTEQQDEQFFH